MLWYKNWLETMPRFLFTVVWWGLFLLLMRMPPWGPPKPVGPAVPIMIFFSIPLFFSSLFLAGTGIRTQPSYLSMTMLSTKSTIYTLSLPVGRRRLLLLRAALGLIEIAFLSAAFAVLFWIVYPRGDIALATMIGLLPKALACSVGLYFLSTFAATLLSETYHMWAVILVIMILPILNGLGLMPSSVLTIITSPVLTGVLPWLQMAAFVILGAVFLLASTKVVESQEY